MHTMSELPINQTRTNTQRNRSYRGQAAVLRVGLLFLFFTTLAISPAIPKSASANAGSDLSVILIIDNSGSMTGNDPDGLRFTAAQLFVSLLDTGDQVGLIRFSTTSTMLTDGMRIIQGPQDKKTLVDLLARVDEEKYTDVKAAFEDVARLARTAAPEGKKVIVFMTDGVPEIPAQHEKYENEILELARGLQIPVLSIALTQNAQSPFLNRLSGETDGQVIFAKSSLDLLDAYLQVLEGVKDRTILGKGTVRAPGAADLVLDAGMAPYVEQMSFVVSKPDLARISLLLPDERILSPIETGVVYHLEDPRFVVFTVDKPVAGNWNIQLSGSGDVQARAILKSRLRARVETAPHLREAGQPIDLEVSLIEEQVDGNLIKIIGTASFSTLITRPDGSQESLDQFYDDGTNGDRLAGDGTYTRQYVNTSLPGVYTFHLQGYKGVIPVSTSVQMTLVPFPDLVISQPERSSYLTCSLFPKVVDFEHKNDDFGTLKAEPDALELRHGIHSESQDLQWGDRGSNRLQGWRTRC